MARKSRGRKRGSRNKGYFYRKSRNVWCANDGGRFTPLLDENNQPIRDEHTAESVLKDAYARYRLTRPVAAGGEVAAMTVRELTDLYLASIKRDGGADTTYNKRADFLFDFCTGFPRKWRKFALNGKPLPERERIYTRHAETLATELTRGTVIAWLNQHQGWGNGTRRMAIQAVRRMLCYGKELDERFVNPIRGIKVPKSEPRVTCLSPEQEEVILRFSKYPLRNAVRMLIHTGMRPAEYTTVTAEHCTDRGDRIEISLRAAETKTRKGRVVFVRDPELVELVRRQCDIFTTGPIFRTSFKNPHVVKYLSRQFCDAKKRAIKKTGMKFDDDCCLYACRHTFAKRCLTGHWNGKPMNIEILAKLMGNTPEVCRRNYLQWSENDQAILWQALA